MSRPIDIQPALLSQVMQTEKGEAVGIDDDVQNVARDLREIDPNLGLRFHPDEGYFSVYLTETGPDGSVTERLVTTAVELDQRLVERVRKVGSDSYDYVGEMEATDRAADRRRDHAHSENVGPKAERLAHAIRKDLGLDSPRIFVPGDKP